MVFKVNFRLVAEPTHNLLGCIRRATTNDEEKDSYLFISQLCCNAATFSLLDKNGTTLDNIFTVVGYAPGSIKLCLLSNVDLTEELIATIQTVKLTNTNTNRCCVHYLDTVDFDPCPLFCETGEENEDCVVVEDKWR